MRTFGGPPRSDPDSDAEHRTDPRFDAWPIERSDAYADVPVERATPRGRGETLGDVPEVRREERGPENVEWLGFAGRGGYVYGPFLYDPEGSAVYEGDLDSDGERVVVDEERRRDVEDDDSLGEHLEAIGEEHGWTWLSSFAREHLEDEPEADRDGTDRGEGDGAGPGLELRDSELVRRNLAASSSVDLGFTASHTLVDESGRVHVVDRFLDVTEAGPDRATVDVEAEFLVAEEPAGHRREGDADLVDEREYGFELELDPGAPNREAEIESRLRTWHAAHVGWPAEA